MYKLWATIKKDVQLLARDKIGVLFMFILPVVLAIVITAIQNSTFELVNDNKASLLLNNHDKGRIGKDFIKTLEKSGMFRISYADEKDNDEQVIARMHKKDALLAVIIPKEFSATMEAKAKTIASKALNNFGAPIDTAKIKVTTDSVEPLTHTRGPPPDPAQIRSAG